MSHHSLLTFASAVLATVPFVDGQILSCADVNCPIAQGTTGAECTVVDKTFDAVGVASLNNSISGFNDLAWVKAVNADDGSGERVFHQTFYLGTPDKFDFGGAGACALFFTQVSDNVRFGDSHADLSKGTCRDAMTDDCISALVDRAKKVDLNSLSSTDACKKLQSDFNNNLDSACTGVAGGSSWVGIQAKALSGSGSPQPISDEQNKTSNCWPILPKSNDLRLVESINATGNKLAATVVKNYFSITPILTVIFPGDGNSSVVSQPEAQLTCLKTIDLTSASAATMSGEDKDNGAADRLFGRAVPAAWVGLMSVMFAVLLA